MHVRAVAPPSADPEALAADGYKLLLVECASAVILSALARSAPMSASDSGPPLPLPAARMRGALSKAAAPHGALTGAQGATTHPHLAKRSTPRAAVPGRPLT